MSEAREIIPAQCEVGAVNSGAGAYNMPFTCISITVLKSIQIKKVPRIYDTFYVMAKSLINGECPPLLRSEGHEL